MITELELNQFCGSGTWYRHWTGKLIYTEGMQYLAENAQAYWLIDAIASYQGEKVLTQDPLLQEFQVWTLTVNEDRTARLVCVADSGQEAAVTQDIELTDFPLSEIKLYVCLGEQLCLMLPSEY
jgi:hypothetical protein